MEGTIINYSEYGECIPRSLNSCVHVKVESSSKEVRKIKTTFLAELDRQGKATGALRVISKTDSIPRFIKGVPNDIINPMSHHERTTALHKINFSDDILGHFRHHERKSINPESSKPEVYQYTEQDSYNDADFARQNFIPVEPDIIRCINHDIRSCKENKTKPMVSVINYKEYGKSISETANSLSFMKTQYLSKEKRKITTDFITHINRYGKATGCLRVVQEIISVPNYINGLPNNGPNQPHHYERKTRLYNVDLSDHIMSGFYQISGQSIDPRSDEKGCTGSTNINPIEPDVFECVDHDPETCKMRP